MSWTLRVPTARPTFTVLIVLIGHQQEIKGYVEGLDAAVSEKQALWRWHRRTNVACLKLELIFRALTYVIVIIAMASFP